MKSIKFFKMVILLIVALYSQNVFGMERRLKLENKENDWKINQALSDTKSNKASDRYDGFSQFFLLVSNGKGFDKAIEVASTGINDEVLAVRKVAFQLWEVLFSKDQGLDKAIELASNGINDKNKYVRASAFQLWAILVYKGQESDKTFFDKAIEAASSGIKDEYVRRSALNLFIELVKKNQGFVEAIEAASEGVKSKDLSVRKTAFQLWIALVSKDRGFDEAIKALSDYSISEEEEEISLGEYVIVVNLYSKDIESRPVRFFVLELLTALVYKDAYEDKGFGKAIETASEGVKSKDLSVRKKAFKLWIALVSKDQGFEEARAAIEIGRKDEYFEIRKLVSELCDLLESTEEYSDDDDSAIDLDEEDSAIDLDEDLESMINMPGRPEISEISEISDTENNKTPRDILFSYAKSEKKQIDRPEMKSLDGLSNYKLLKFDNEPLYSYEINKNQMRRNGLTYLPFDLRGAEICDTISFQQGKEETATPIFSKMIFDGIILTTNMYFKGFEVNPLIFDEDVSFEGAQFKKGSGLLGLGGSKEVSFENVQFNSNLNFNNLIIEEDVTLIFKSVEINSNIQFYGLQCSGKIDISKAGKSKEKIGDALRAALKSKKINLID